MLVPTPIQGLSIPELLARWLRIARKQRLTQLGSTRGHARELLHLRSCDPNAHFSDGIGAQCGPLTSSCLEQRSRAEPCKASGWTASLPAGDMVTESSRVAWGWSRTSSKMGRCRTGTITRCSACRRRRRHLRSGPRTDSWPTCCIPTGSRTRPRPSGHWPNAGCAKSTLHGRRCQMTRGELTTTGRCIASVRVRVRRPPIPLEQPPLARGRQLRGRELPGSGRLGQGSLDREPMARDPLLRARVAHGGGTAPPVARTSGGTATTPTRRFSRRGPRSWIRTNLTFLRRNTGCCGAGPSCWCSSSGW